MSEYAFSFISSLEMFLISDQPTTCPKCGVRTEIILNLFDSETDLQVNVCLSLTCRFVFLSAEK